jgi:hypothetical protein
MPPQPPTAPQAVEKIVTYKAAQEGLALRLGSALILQWDALPDALQDLLIDQAVIGKYGVDDQVTHAHIENFIRTAKTTAVLPPPEAPAEEASAAAQD